MYIATAYIKVNGIEFQKRVTEEEAQALLSMRSELQGLRIEYDLWD